MTCHRQRVDNILLTAFSVLSGMYLPCKGKRLHRLFHLPGNRKLMDVRIHPVDIVS